jgi:CDP-glucose 4,6-dehydratase
MNVDPNFWKGKRVFLTGHSGFKGGWLSLWMASMGAEVFGFSLPPNTTPNLFEVIGVEKLVKASQFGDIRNYEELFSALEKSKADIVIHMAAQPLVRYSYENPIETYATNVMGTVNLLEAVRQLGSVRATVVVTTDKCYENREWVWGYRENEPMGGYDPYSSSKGCAELAVSAFRRSYFSKDLDGAGLLASARAGNVIGGGDWSADRLIPDALRAFQEGKPLMIRNPKSTRPWQHVLEPLSGYLILVQALYEKGVQYASGWNFGPRDEDARPVGDVVNLLVDGWGRNASWLLDGADQPHEASFLKLDCSKSSTQLGWSPRWDLETAIEKIISWHQALESKENMQVFTLKQISQFNK